MARPCTVASGRGRTPTAATKPASWQVSLPPGNAFPSWDAIGGLIRFGSLMFAAGLTIAMPVGFVLILVQIIMGVIGRSAPALNLFAVGIPATLLAGIVLLGIATPAMAEAIARFLSDALDAARMVAGI